MVILLAFSQPQPPLDVYTSFFIDSFGDFGACGPVFSSYSLSFPVQLASRLSETLRDWWEINQLHQQTSPLLSSNPQKEE
jgi:hypothetical protein